MTDAIFREAIIIKKKHSDFFPISELPILPFHMWFGFRFRARSTWTFWSTLSHDIVPYLICMFYKKKSHFVTIHDEYLAASLNFF